MTYAQTARYTRRHLGVGAGDREGAGVAHQELLRAVVRFSDAAGFHAFCDGYGVGQQTTDEQAWAELNSLRPDRTVEIHHATELPTLATRERYVFYTSGMLLSPLAVLRESLERGTFPIFMVTHALDLPALFLGSAQWFAKPSDRILVSSQAARQTVEALRAAGDDIAQEAVSASAVPRAQLEYIPLGVDTDFLQPGDQRLARRVLGLPSDRMIVLYLGRFSLSEKADLGPLLVAFRDILRQHPEAFLVLAGQEGDEGYGTVLRNMAERLDVRAHVRFMGNFPFFAKPLIYSAADIFVSPADNIQETFGLSVLEAMACGLPVVASDWSGYRDLVEHGRTGFLIPTYWNPEGLDELPGLAYICHSQVRRRLVSRQTIVDGGALRSALELLAQDADMRRRFGEAGRRRAEQCFSWPVIVSRHEQMWREAWAELAQYPHRQPRRFEDYNRLFGHYATRFLDRSQVVRLTAFGADYLHGCNGSESEASRRALTACRERPATIASLLNGQSSAGLRHVLDLLKSGVLEVV